MPRGAGGGGSSPRPGAGRWRGPVRGGPPAAAGPALRWGCASGPAWHRRPAAASRGREPAPLEPVTAALSPSGGKAAAAGPGGGGRRRRRWGGAGLRGRRASAGLRRRGGPGPGGGCLRDWAPAAAPPGAVCRGRWLGFGAAAAPFLSVPRPFGVWKNTHTHTRLRRGGSFSVRPIYEPLWHLCPELRPPPRLGSAGRAPRVFWARVKCVLRENRCPVPGRVRGRNSIITGTRYGVFFAIPPMLSFGRSCWWTGTSRALHRTGCK